MDPLEIKAEPKEFFVTVFDSLSDNDIKDENEGYESESSCVLIEESDHIENDFAGIDGENGHLYVHQANDDSSSEPTLSAQSEDEEMRDEPIGFHTAVDPETIKSNNIPNAVQSNPNRFISTKAQLDILDYCMMLDCDKETDKDADSETVNKDVWNMLVRELNKLGPARTSQKWKKVLYARKYNSKKRLNRRDQQQQAYAKRTDVASKTAAASDTIPNRQNRDPIHNQDVSPGAHNIQESLGRKDVVPGARNIHESLGQKDVMPGARTRNIHELLGRKNYATIHSIKSQDNFGCECATKLWPVVSDKLNDLISEIRKGNELLEKFLSK